jgi:TPR repeat protein/CHAT domain-containing protein
VRFLTHRQNAAYSPPTSAKKGKKLAMSVSLRNMHVLGQAALLACIVCLTTARPVLAAEDYAARASEARKLMDKGLYPKALEAWEKSASDLEKAYGGNDPRTIQARYMLARTRMKCARHDEAATLLKQVAVDQAKEFGEDNLYVLRTKITLAENENLSGKPQAAEERLTALRPVVERVLGPEHPETLRLDHELAVALCRQQKPEADGLLRDVLHRREHILGPEHPDTLTSRNNLAGVYYNLGDYAKAKKLYAQVLEARARTLGPEHPDTLNTRSMFVGVDDNLGENSNVVKYDEHFMPVDSDISVDTWMDQIYAVLLSGNNKVNKRAKYLKMYNMGNIIAGIFFEYSSEDNYIKDEWAKKNINNNVISKLLEIIDTNPKAQSTLGIIYYSGLAGQNRNYEEAIKLFRRAAERNDALAQNNLGVMYEHGIGIKRDYAEAIKWYRKAAEHNISVAQTNLGLIYENGRGVIQDYAEAVKWYRLGAKQNYALAQANLGWMYENGRGVTQNDAEAVKWYRLAAEQNHASAQNNLGVMYEKGHGVKQDDVEAVKWYHMAAEQNNARAQNNLGWMYATGRGITQNYIEAVKLYCLSAEQNYAQAQTNLGSMYYDGRGVRQDYSEMIKWYRLALENYERQFGSEHPETLNACRVLADGYLVSGNYAKSEYLYEQVEEILERIKGPEHPDTLIARSKRGTAYYRLGDYSRARELYEKVLVDQTRIQGADHPDTLYSRSNLAYVYIGLGDYVKAIELFAKVLEDMDRIIGPEHTDTLATRSNFAVVYIKLGDYINVRDLNVQILKTRERILGTDHPDTLISRTNLAIAYFELGDYAKAKELFTRILEASERSLGAEHPDTQTARCNIARVYDTLGDYVKAKEQFVQALEVLDRILGPEHPDTLIICNNLASVYCNLDDYAKAKALLAQVMETRERIQGARHPDTAHTAATLSRTFARSGDMASAIFYAKLAVEASQQQRRSLRGLEKELQQSYLQTIEYRYHFLARLLIEEGRPEEAQEVLHLLKESELSDLSRTEARTAQGIFFGPEKALRVEFMRLVEAMHGPYTLRTALLEKKKQSPLTKDEESELQTLQKNIADAAQNFRDFSAGLPAKLKAGRAGILADPDRLRNVRELRALMSKLGQGTAVIHTLSAEDTLYLFLTTRDVFKVYPVNSKRADLEKRAAEFSLFLTSPRLDPRPAAQAMHALIMAPLTDDLRAAGADTLMFSLDGALRYVPMAALHDGKQWLIETYNITMFTEAARNRLTAEFPADVQVAALGLTEAKDGFPPLPAVKGELESIVREKQGERGVLPGFRRLDADFNYQTLSAAMRAGTPVLHIAGHFQFEPVAPDQSFLVLGDGGKVTLFHFNADPALPFVGIDQLTLSACETAAGLNRGDGSEVEGFGALAQTKGAKSVIATLWPIADASTELLMRDFYRLRFVEKQSKALALRNAQRGLIRNSSGKPANPMYATTRGLVISTLPTEAGNSPRAWNGKGYSHPYYWAPFILMGNWK